MTTENFIKILTIAAKYGDSFAAEHDIVYFCGPPPTKENAEQNNEVWTLEWENDSKEMQALGAFFEDSTDSWARFV